MSDLVERLRDREAMVLSGLFHCGPVMLEAATALTAKDKEIEALRERVARSERIAVGECRTANERLVEMANMQARAARAVIEQGE